MVARSMQSRKQPIGRTHLPIHNPSYATNPTMWHAVAMQQQRLSDLKLSLGPPPLRASRLRRPGAPAPPAPPAASRQQDASGASTSMICGECSSDDDDNGEIGGAPAPALTLAQRMGLAEAPEPELTSSEWDAIAAISREREASREPCVICQEGFKDAKQVLLSCGHTFHRQCLRSWEAHSKSRCCPVCRKKHYRRRAISDGANLYREECAVLIQRIVRGVLARRATAKALRHANPDRMRRYCQDRLSGLTDQLVDRLDAERSAVDDLFAEIDSSVAAARQLFDANSIDWARTEAVARGRGLGDCPVCLQPLRESERLSLLSCTHVFHCKCLASFESFHIGPTCACPVCRAAYTKIEIGAPRALEAIDIVGPTPQQPRDVSDAGPSSTTTTMRAAGSGGERRPSRATTGRGVGSAVAAVHGRRAGREGGGSVTAGASSTARPRGDGAGGGAASSAWGRSNSMGHAEATALLAGIATSGAAGAGRQSSGRRGTPGR